MARLTRDEVLWKICKDIYRQMYKESKPSRSFDDIVKSEEGKKPNWFMRYFLPMERQVEIAKEHIKKHKLRDYDRRKVENHLWLNYSPNSCEKTWKEHRK